MQSRVLAFTALSLLACVVPRTVGTTVRVLLPEQLRAEYRAAPCEFFGPRNATVQASLVLADPSNACSPLRVPCGGAVLLAEPLSGCSFETKARHAQRAGCAAMLVHDDTFSVPGGSTSGLYQFDGSDRSDLQIMLQSMLRRDWGVLASEVRGGANVTVLVSVTPGELEANPWRVLWRHPLFMAAAILIGPVSLATFVLALHRLRAIIAQQRMDGRPCFTVATLILGIQAFTSLVRGVFGTVDPLGVYHVLPRLWWMVSATFTFPAELACVLLLAYWWRHLLNTVRTSVALRPRVAIPFAAGLVGLQAVEVWMSVRRGLFQNTPHYDITVGAIYALSQLVFGVGFAVYGFKVSSQLGGLRGMCAVRRGSGGAPARKPASEAVRLSRFVALSGVFMLMFCAGACIAATPARGYPLGTALMLLASAHGMNFQALLRVLVFRPKPLRSSSVNLVAGGASARSRSKLDDPSSTL